MNASAATRVAVTGLGSISALGHNVPGIWSALAEGRSGIAEITLAPSNQLNIKIAAEVKGYDQSAHFDERELLVPVARHPVDLERRREPGRGQAGVATSRCRRRSQRIGD